MRKLDAISKCEKVYFSFSSRNENESLRLTCVKITLYRNESENWSHVFNMIVAKKGRCKAGGVRTFLTKLLSASKCGNEVRYEGWPKVCQTGKGLIVVQSATSIARTLFTSLIANHRLCASS